MKRNKRLSNPSCKILWTILKMNKRELRQMDQRTKKLMTKHKVLYPKGDVDRQFLLGKRGRGLSSIVNFIDASLHGLEDDIKKSKERLITAANNKCGNISTERKTTKTRKENWEEKQLFEYFK